MKRKKARNLVINIYMMLLSATVAYAYDVYPPLAEISALKSKMGIFTGMTDSTLHVYAGLAIFGIVSLVFHKPFRSNMPWLIVLSVAILNEFLDIQNSISHIGYGFLSNCLTDILYTIVLPSSILIMAKLKHPHAPKRANSVVHIRAPHRFPTLTRG